MPKTATTTITPTETTCKSCGAKDNLHAKGLCRTCYNKEYKKRTKKTLPTNWEERLGKLEELARLKQQGLLEERFNKLDESIAQIGEKMQQMSERIDFVHAFAIFQHNSLNVSRLFPVLPMMDAQNLALHNNLISKQLDAMTIRSGTPSGSILNPAPHSNNPTSLSNNPTSLSNHPTSLSNHPTSLSNHPTSILSNSIPLSNHPTSILSNTTNILNPTPEAPNSLKPEPFFGSTLAQEIFYNAPTFDHTMLDLNL